MSLLDNTVEISSRIDKEIADKLLPNICTFGKLHLANMHINEIITEYEPFYDTGFFRSKLNKSGFINICGNFYNYENVAVSRLDLQYDEKDGCYYFMILNPKLPVYIDIRICGDIPEYIKFKAIGRPREVSFIIHKSIDRIDLKIDKINFKGNSKININCGYF